MQPMASCQEKIDLASEYTLPSPKVVLGDLCQQKGLLETVVDQIVSSLKYQDLEAASCGIICLTNRNPWGSQMMLQRRNAWALEIRANQYLWMRGESLEIRLRLITDTLNTRNRLFPTDQNPMPRALLYSLMGQIIEDFYPKS